MSYPRSVGMFILYTDASDRCYGACLSQLQTSEKGEVEEQTIAYASKQFKGRETKYCARRRELLAIIRFVKHFDVYLRGPYPCPKGTFNNATTGTELDSCIQCSPGYYCHGEGNTV